MQDLLKKYDELQAQQAALQAELATTAEAIRAFVAVNGEVKAHGRRAYFKPGRKSVNHEAAYLDALAAIRAGDTADNHITRGIEETRLRDIELKHSTVKTTVAWAKVTAAAKLDTSAYVTEGEPAFTIE